MKLAIHPPPALGGNDLDMGTILFPDWWMSDLWKGGRAPESPKTDGPAIIAEKRNKSQGKKDAEQLPKPKRPPKQKCPPVPYQILEDIKWVNAYFSSSKEGIEQHGFDKAASVLHMIELLRFDCEKSTIDITLDSWQTEGPHASVALTRQDLDRLTRLVDAYYQASNSDVFVYEKQLRTLLLDIYSIKVIPLLKQGKLVPESYKLYLLQLKIRSNLMDAVDKAKEIAESLLTYHLDSELAEWVQRMSEDKAEALFHFLLEIDPDAPPPSAVIQADIGPTFSSSSSDPAECSSPLAGTYRVERRHNNRKRYERDFDLSNFQLRYVDTRADPLIPPDFGSRGLKLETSVQRKLNIQIQLLCNSLNMLRQHEHSVKEYYEDKRKEAAEKAREESERAAPKTYKPSPLVNAVELVGTMPAIPEFWQWEEESMSQPGAQLHATHKKVTKVRRPPDRVAKRKSRDTLKVKAQIKKVKRGDTLPDRAILKEINKTTKVDSILRLVQYMAEFEADVREDAGKLQPAPQVVKGVLLTPEERLAFKIEAVRKAQEEAEIARVAAMAPYQQSLYHSSRSASSEERCSPRSLDKSGDLQSSRVLSSRRASNSGKVSRRRTPPPPRSRSSERIRSRMVSGEPAFVGHAPPLPPLRTIPITPRSNRPRSSSASSETSETDDEDDNELEWPVKKYASSSSSRGINYLQANAALRSAVGRQPTIIEELGDGFSEEDEAASDEDSEEQGDEDELDEDIDHETDDEDEDGDEDDDGCDSIMPSPPRKWIELGSPFAEDEEDIEASSSDSEGEAEAVAKDLIPVPQDSSEKYYDHGEEHEQEEEEDPVMLDEDDETLLRNALASLYAYGPPEAVTCSAPEPLSDSDEDKENDRKVYDRFMQTFLEDDDERAWHPMTAASALSDDSGCYEAVTQPPSPVRAAPVRRTYGKRIAPPATPAKRKYEEDQSTPRSVRDMSINDFLCSGGASVSGSSPEQESFPKSSNVLQPRRSPPGSPSKKARLKSVPISSNLAQSPNGRKGSRGNAVQCSAVDM